MLMLLKEPLLQRKRSNRHETEKQKIASLRRTVIGKACSANPSTEKSSEAILLTPSCVSLPCPVKDRFMDSVIYLAKCDKK